MNRSLCRIMLAEERKQESVEAKDDEIEPLNLNGTWEYDHIENLQNFLIGMNVGWAKQKLAASIAAVISVSYTVIQNGNDITQTIESPIRSTTRSYSVGDGKLYKYKAYKGSDIQSSYKWNHDKTVLHGSSENLTRNTSYTYTMHTEYDEKIKKQKLILTTTGKTDELLKVYFIKKD